MSSEGQFPVLYPAFSGSARVPESSPSYVNGLAIIYSPWDFNLLFLRGLPSQPLASSESEETDGERQRRELVPELVQQVVMSPEHAKSMAARLLENVEAYEKEHGEIPTIAPGTSPEQEDSTSQASSADKEP